MTSTKKPAVDSRTPTQKMLPQSFRVGVVHPLVRNLRALKQSFLDPSIEAASLSLGALLSKLTLRLPGLSAKALGAVDEQWSQRIADAMACPDNERIPRCDGAGSITGSCIIMHNGLRVRALGYYGPGMLNLLVRNRGVHEPQEERAFGEVLPFMPSGAVMVELGAYWGFYSLWFASKVEGARCFLFEPDPRNLQVGRQNFKLNGLRGSFSRSAVGNRFSTQLKAVRLSTLGELLEQKRLSHVHLLHADIQGAELDMLAQAGEVFDRECIDFVFLSTHSEQLHQACRDYLENREYFTLCSASPAESYSLDGVLVAKRKGVIGPDSLAISKKKRLSGLAP